MFYHGGLTISYREINVSVNNFYLSFICKLSNIMITYIYHFEDSFLLSITGIELDMDTEQT